MIDKNITVEEIATLKAKIEQESAPAAKDLDAISREKIFSRAAVEGWTPAQAEWLDRLAKQPLFQAVADGVPGNEALEQAYQIARRKLTTSYFEHALDTGKDRTTAFLTVIDLERQLAERRGEVALQYSDEMLLEACHAVTVAAQRDASAEEQIETGFAVIRKMVEKSLN